MVNTTTKPQAPVQLLPPVPGGTAYRWKVTCCPYCGKKHIHGAGDSVDESDGYLGSRTPHCTGEEYRGLPDYYLVRVD